MPRPTKRAVAIVAAGDELYQLHGDGWIWRFTGGDPAWEALDMNAATVQIAAAPASVAAN